MVLIQNHQKTLEKLLKLENLPKLEKFLKEMNGLKVNKISDTNQCLYKSQSDLIVVVLYVQN